jgi:hypothetical protein
LLLVPRLLLLAGVAGVTGVTVIVGSPRLITVANKAPESKQNQALLVRECSAL